MIRRIIPAALIIVLTGMMITGCSEENSPVDAGKQPQQSAPDLPSSATMKMDISLFESVPLEDEAIINGTVERGSSLYLSAAGNSRLNFLNAAVRALYLRVVVYSAMVAPVAAFEAAINSVPQPQADGSWLWTYLFVDSDGEFRIYLYGIPEEEYVEWRMEVSSTGPANPLDHFIWLEGRVYRGERRGYWQFYEVDQPGSLAVATLSGASATPGIKSIMVEWEDQEPDSSRIDFIVNKPGVPENGSELSFSESDTHSAISFYDSAEDQSGEIVWYPEGSGYIQWPDYMEGERRCWDQNQYDTGCPVE